MSKILVDRKVLEQALEAMEEWNPSLWTTADEAAITALRAALAQREQEQEQEPVAWGCFKNGVLNTELIGTEADVDFWCASDESEMLGMVKGPIYTSPPRREWKGLTDEEHLLVIDNTLEGGSILDVARAVETLLRNRNNT